MHPAGACKICARNIKLTHVYGYLPELTVSASYFYCHTTHGRRTTSLSLASQCLSSISPLKVRTVKLGWNKSVEEIGIKDRIFALWISITQNLNLHSILNVNFEIQNFHLHLQKSDRSVFTVGTLLPNLVYK